MPGLRDDPGLWLLLHLRPPRDRRLDEHGTCAVCGQTGRFVSNHWTVSRELARRWGEALVRRESMFCSTCGSSRRVRRMAEVLVSLYGRDATTVADLVREAEFSSLRIAEINSVGRMHPFLAAVPSLLHVEYPDEDIQSLSWPDETFDLVLTSETLEHVADPRLALRETRRVLVPGGRHLFTVPIDPARTQTVSRSDKPPEHHGRGGGPFSLVTRRSDMLVHTDFGTDVDQVIADAGLVPELYGAGYDLVLGAVRPRETGGAPSAPASEPAG